jgi:catechol 2,3-dioxygenase-like lactoylglutathione lyase family enzyme
MGEAVEKRGGHLCVAEDGRPFAEGEVGGGAPHHNLRANELCLGVRRHDGKQNCRRQNAYCRERASEFPYQYSLEPIIVRAVTARASSDQSTVENPSPASAQIIKSGIIANQKHKSANATIFRGSPTTTDVSTLEVLSRCRVGTPKLKPTTGEDETVPAKSKRAICMEGLTLAVKDVRRSISFYRDLLGLTLEIESAPDFALIRVGGQSGGTIGLLAAWHANRKGTKNATRAQHAAIHVELSTDDLDGLYRRLRARGVRFHEPPHDEEWERAMVAYDPDGYTVEIAQGRRGHNQPKARGARL